MSDERRLAHLLVAAAVFAIACAAGPEWLPRYLVVGYFSAKGTAWAFLLTYRRGMAAGRRRARRELLSRAWGAERSA